MNSEIVTYRLSRLQASVAVVSDPHTRDWLRFRTSQYFRWSTPNDGKVAWHVVGGRENAPMMKWTPYSRHSSHGEYCHFLVNHSTRFVVVDLPPGPWRHLFILRVIRNILRWELFLLGAVFLHASCLSWRGRGVALFGPSRSGKSTLLLKLLSEKGCDYVTEDDVTIAPQFDGKLVALGWPGCVRMRRHMLSGFPTIATKAAEFTHPANLLERNGDLENTWLRIFPEEIVHRFGCGLVPEILLKAGLWLGWDKCVSIQELCQGEMERRLIASWDVLPERKAGARPHLIDWDHPKWSDLVFDQFLLEAYGVPALSRHEETLKLLASTIQGFAVTHCGEGFTLNLV
jgi:hypothetical protein